MINCNEDSILVGKIICLKDKTFHNESHFAQKTINLKYSFHILYVQTTIIFFYQFQHNTLFIHYYIPMKNGIMLTPE